MTESTSCMSPTRLRRIIRASIRGDRFHDRSRQFAAASFQIGKLRRSRWPLLAHGDLPDCDDRRRARCRYTVDVWSGHGARGTPAHIDRLNGEINRVVRDPDRKERLNTVGLEAVGTTPEQLLKR